MRLGLDLKILWFPLTGMGRAAYETAKNLPSIGKDHEFYYFFNEREIPDFHSFDNVKSVIIDHSNYRGKTGVLKRIYAEQVLMSRAISKYKLDILHVPAYCAPVFFKKKLVLTIYDIAFLLYPGILKKAAYYYWKTFLTWNVKRCSRILVCSSSTKKDLVEYFKIESERIVCIPLGINRDRFFHLEDSHKREQIKRKYLLPDRYILFVGTLEPRKNLNRLLKAYSLLPRELKKLYPLVLAGSKGWKYSGFFELIKELELKDSIIFTDRISDDDLAGVYSCAALLAFPSLYEGFGFPILEAMACGTPVLSSNVSSIPEVAGDAAILVDPLSEQEIAEGLKRLLEDAFLRKDLSGKGLQRVLKFDWKKTAENTLKAYEACF